MDLTVKELIEKLKEMPEDSKIILKEYLFNTDLWTSKNAQSVSLHKDKVLID